MMRPILSITAIIIAFVYPQSGFAREVPAWDIDKLSTESDVIVIVEHIETRDARDGAPNVPPDHPSDLEMLTPVVSKLSTIIVLKGSITTKEFLLPHYRFDWKKYGKSGIGNGPRLIAFDREDPKADWGRKRRYMLFLKERDNTLAPVTGLFDPIYSLRELSVPKMNSLGVSAYAQRQFPIVESR